MNNKFFYSLIIAIVLVGMLLLFNNNKEPTITLVQPTEFASLLDQEDVFVINTHTPYDGEIDGTDIIIEDWENIARFSNQLPKDKNTKILVYCRSGRMSSSAASQLSELGYNNVYDLNGGMKAWKASGHEIIFKEDL